MAPCQRALDRLRPAPRVLSRALTRPFTVHSRRSGSIRAATSPHHRHCLPSVQIGRRGGDAAATQAARDPRDHQVGPTESSQPTPICAALKTFWCVQYVLCV